MLNKSSMTQFMTCYSSNNLNSEHSDKLLSAGQILSIYQSQDLASLKSKFIDFDKPSSLLQAQCQFADITHHPDETIFNPIQHANYEPQCFDNLYQHLRHLQLEFVGQSELSFYHTLLIVLMRRGYDVSAMFEQFECLWNSATDYFFKHLSLRWLVSAADTFIDFSPSPLRRAILMNVVSLVNTLKAYETQQRVLVDCYQLDRHKIQCLSDKHLGLYDGLTYLRLGCDDTIEHMRRRFLAFEQEDAFATQFLVKIFDRLHDNPTAYAFFKHLHTEDWGYQW